MEDYDNILNEYTLRLFYGGLDGEDAFCISKIMKDIEDIISRIKYKKDKYIRLNGYIIKEDSDKEKTKREEYIKTINEYDISLNYFNELLGRFYNIYVTLNEHGVLDKTIEEQIIDNSILFHLVYTNDNNKTSKIRYSGKDTFFLSCQFHQEKTPSMSIVNSRNYLHCFGCGSDYDPISYLEKVENITRKQAIDLLAKIYMLEIKDNQFKDDELVYKYQQMLISEDFYEIFNKAYIRLCQQEKTPMVRRTIDIFEKDNEIIRRVKTRTIKKIEEQKGKKYQMNPPSFTD